MTKIKEGIEDILRFNKVTTPTLEGTLVGKLEIYINKVREEAIVEVLNRLKTPERAYFDPYKVEGTGLIDTDKWFVQGYNEAIKSVNKKVDEYLQSIKEQDK